MHNQRCQCGILDLDAGLIAVYGLLNGKGCHSAKKLLQCFLTGNKVAKGVVDQHVVARVICKVAIWLEHIRIGSDHNVNTLLHKEVGPFFFVFGRHWFFGLAQFAEKITQSAEALACLMAAATSAVLNVSIIEPFPEVDVSVLPELSASPVELSEVSELAESFAEPSELSVLSPELTVWLPYDGKV